MFFHDFKQILNLWVVVRILGYLLTASTVIAFNCTAISRIKIQSQGLKLQASFRTKVNFLFCYFFSFFLLIFLSGFSIQFILPYWELGLDSNSGHSILYAVWPCFFIGGHWPPESSCDFPQQQRHSEDLEICSPLWYSRGNNTSNHPAVLASR